MTQKINIPQQNQPFRRQSSLGGDVSFRDIGQENDNSFITMAKVTKVYYNKGRLDFKLANTNNIVQEVAGSQGVGSAPIPVDFFGRKPDGTVFGHYRPVKIGDSVAIAYLNGKKSNPIVIGVYPNSSQDYEYISPAMYNDGDDNNSGVAETGLADRKVYPSMQTEYRSGSGTIAKALNGHSFLVIDDETSVDYRQLWQNYKTVGFFNSNGKTINPLKEKAGDWTLIHEDNPKAPNADNHRTRFFVSKQGELQVVFMDNTSTGDVLVLEGAQHKGFTMTQYYDTPKRKAGDLSDNVYNPDLYASPRYVRFNLGGEGKEASIESSSLKDSILQSTQLAVRTDGVYVNGKLLVSGDREFSDESLLEKAIENSPFLKNTVKTFNDSVEKVSRETNDAYQKAEEAADAASANKDSLDKLNKDNQSLIDQVSRNARDAKDGLDKANQAIKDALRDANKYTDGRVKNSVDDLSASITSNKTWIQNWVLGTAHDKIVEDTKASVDTMMQRTTSELDQKIKDMDETVKQAVSSANGASEAAKTAGSNAVRSANEVQDHIDEMRNNMATYLRDSKDNQFDGNGGSNPNKSNMWGKILDGVYLDGTTYSTHMVADVLEAGTLDGINMTFKNVVFDEGLGNHISANTIDTGTLNAVTIKAGSITADKINSPELATIAKRLGDVEAGSITIGKMQKGNNANKPIDPNITRVFDVKKTFNTVSQRQDPIIITDIPGSFWQSVAGRTVSFTVDVALENYINKPISIQDTDLACGVRFALNNGGKVENHDFEVNTRNLPDKITTTLKLQGSINVPTSCTGGNTIVFGNLRAGKITIGGFTFEYSNPDYDNADDAFRVDRNGHVTANSVDIGPGGLSISDEHGNQTTHIDSKGTLITNNIIINGGIFKKGHIYASDDPNSGVQIDGLDADNPDMYTPAKKAFLKGEIKKLDSAAEAAIDYGKNTGANYSGVENAKEAMDNGLAGLLADMTTTTEFNHNTVIDLEQDLQDAINAFHNKTNSDILAKIGTTANGKNAIYRGTEEPQNPHTNDVWLQILNDGTYNIRVWDGNQWINPGLADIKAVSDSVSTLPRSYYSSTQPSGTDYKDGDIWYKTSTDTTNNTVVYTAYKWNHNTNTWDPMLDATSSHNYIGSAPVNPIEGDFWMDNTTLKQYQNGVWKTIPTQGPQGIPGVSAKQQYIHIAYSTSANGTENFNNSTFSGATYIGLLVDFNEEDSSDPTKYTWSRLRGADGTDGKDGVPGKPGADGKTSYVHFAYANSSDGTANFNLEYFDNALYIGTYTDFTESDSKDHTKYTWSRLKGDKGANGKDGVAGKDGVGLKRTEVTYGLSESDSTQPSRWSSQVPNLVKGQYLWSKTVWTYTDDTSETGYQKTYIAKDGNDGNDGIAGKDGVGIRSTTITYAVGTSGTTAPTSGWDSQVPNVPVGQYLWTKTIWSYTDNTNETGYSVAKMGDTGPKGDPGKDGVPGPKGADGKTYYTWIKYATDSSGSNISDSPTGMSYIGIAYNKESQTESSTPTDYKWTKIKGDDGIPGAPGADGKTSYFHVAYANSSDGKKGFYVGGGNNLLTGTSEDELSGKSYDFAQYSIAGGLKPGTTYTLSGWARVDQKAIDNQQHVFVCAYTSDWSWSSWLNIDGSLTEKYNTVTFTTPTGKSFSPVVTIYLSHPNGDSSKDPISGTGYISKLKLEEGSAATPWSPAPSEAHPLYMGTYTDYTRDGSIDPTRYTWVPMFDSTKKRNFTTQPTTPYAVGDTWTQSGATYFCTTARDSGAFSASDWTMQQLTIQSLDSSVTNSLYNDNLVIGTSQDIVVDDTANTGTQGWRFNTIPINADLKVGDKITVSVENVTMTGKGDLSKWGATLYSTDISECRADSYEVNAGKNAQVTITVNSMKDPNKQTALLIYSGRVSDTEGKKAVFHHLKVERGTIATPWCLSQSELTTTTRDYKGVTLNDSGLTATAGSTSVAMNSNDGFLIKNGTSDVFHVDTSGNLNMKGNIIAGNISGVNFTGDNLTLNNSLQVINGSISADNGNVVLDKQGLSIKGASLSISDSSGNQTTYVDQYGTFVTNKGTFTGSVTANKLIIPEGSHAEINVAGKFMVKPTGEVIATSFTSTNGTINYGTINGTTISAASIKGGTINGSRFETNAYAQNYDSKPPYAGYGTESGSLVSLGSWDDSGLVIRNNAIDLQKTLSWSNTDGTHDLLKWLTYPHNRVTGAANYMFMSNTGEDFQTLSGYEVIDTRYNNYPNHMFIPLLTVNNRKDLQSLDIDYYIRTNTDANVYMVSWCTDLDKSIIVDSYGLPKVTGMSTPPDSFPTGYSIINKASMHRANDSIQLFSDSIDIGSTGSKNIGVGLWVEKVGFSSESLKRTYVAGGSLAQVGKDHSWNLANYFHVHHQRTTITNNANFIQESYDESGASRDVIMHNGQLQLTNSEGPNVSTNTFRVDGSGISFSDNAFAMNSASDNQKIAFLGNGKQGIFFDSYGNIRGLEGSAYWRIQNKYGTSLVDFPVDGQNNTIKFNTSLKVLPSGADHGIRTAWVSWSGWDGGERYPAIVQDGPNWGGIAFPKSGQVTLFDHYGHYYSPDKNTGMGNYNGYGGY